MGSLIKNAKPKVTGLLHFAVVAVFCVFFAANEKDNIAGVFEEINHLFIFCTKFKTNNC